MRVACVLLVLTAVALGETSFDVKWKKALRPDKRGVLRIDDSGLAFRPSGKGEPERAWEYTDIQHFDRLSLTEIEILSYEDSAWRLGLDRRYRFVLDQGEFDDASFAEIVSRIGKPATDRVVAPLEGAELEIPAKRLRLRGGTHGTLYVTRERIVYSSTSPKDSRDWRLDRDVDSVWSSDPYRFEVHVHDGREGYGRQPSTYRFALKRPLDRTLYERLKMQLYELDRTTTPLR